MSFHLSAADPVAAQSARIELMTAVAHELETSLPAGARAAADEIRARHESSVAAIVFYGSCLRAFEQGDPQGDGVYDFYLLVNRYSDIYGSWSARVANAILAPNVFSLRDPSAPSGVLAKYGVVSLARLSRAVSVTAFDSYFWARLAQPARLAYVRDAATRNRVIEAFAGAVVTTVSKTLPLMAGPFNAEDLWTRAFDESYGAELRAESARRSRQLCTCYRERYRAITSLAITAAGLRWKGGAQDGCLEVSVSKQQRQRARVAWALRRMAGKALTALRVGKAAITFEGGFDYLLWKIGRHSGKRVTPTPWQRRHPFLAGPVVLWRLYRLGAYR